jgi:hypothetical protein
MKKLASIAALAVTAVLAVPTAGNAAVDTSKTYRISTPWSLVLEIAGESRGDGAPLTQWPVNGGTHQQWRFDYLGTSNHYRIRNVNSNKCITAPGGSTLPRTKLVQWTCGRAGQEFAVDEYATSTGATRYVKLVVPGADAAIDVPENSPYWGTQLQLWPRVDSYAQDFLLNPLV